jgi:uncharacterized membrane protein
MQKDFEGRLHDLQDQIERAKRQLDWLSGWLQRISSDLSQLQGKEVSPETPGVISTEPVSERVQAPPKVEAPPPRPSRLKAWLTKKEIDWETLLGEKLFHRLGIIILILGIAFLIGYFVPQTGKTGKILGGTALGITLIVLGSRLRKRKDLQKFGLSLVGGGWAVLYFTAFAAQYIKAVQLIYDARLGLALSILITLGMLIHSLHLRSQTMSGLAYGLGFLAVAKSSLVLTTLGTLVFLTGSLLILSLKLGWTVLPTLGLAATYVVHGLWLSDRVLCDSQGPLPAFWYSSCLLCFYWLSYLIPHLLRKVETSWELGMLFVNATGFAFLGANHVIQAFQGQLYLFFYMVALVYITLNSITYLSQRVSIARGGILIGSVLLAVGSLDLFTGRQISLAWCIEAELLLVVGLIIKDGYFRVASAAYLIAGLVKLIYTGVHLGDTIQILDRTMTANLPLYALISLIAIINSILCAKVIRKGIAIRYEKGLWYLFTYGGAFLVWLSIWNFFKPVEISVALGLAGLIWGQTGLIRFNPHLLIQGGLLVLFGTGYLFCVEFPADSLPRAICYLTLVGFNCYLYQATITRPSVYKFMEWLSRVHIWAAVISLLYILEVELPGYLTMPGWALVGAVLLYLGYRTDIKTLRLQGGLIVLPTLVKGYIVGAQELTTLLLAVGLGGTSLLLLAQGYLSRVWSERFTPSIPTRVNLPILFCFAGTALLAYLLWCELGGKYLTIGWALEGAFLVVLGIASKVKSFRVPGLVLLVLCILKAGVIDFAGLETPYRVLSFIGLGLMLLVASYLYIKYRHYITDYSDSKAKTDA